MEVIDAFTDLFTTSTLIHSINHVDHVPSRLEQLGLFAPEPISTTTVIIEEDNGTITLVPTAPRGGVPEPVSLDRRKARSFVVPHIPTMSQVHADEVQNVRAYGAGGMAASGQAAVEQVRDRKLEKARMRINATIEHLRMTAIKGIILDADGSTEIFNLFTEFGVSQSTLGMDMDVATTDLLRKIREAQRLSQTALKGDLVTGWHAFVGDTFFDELVSHPELKALYLNWQASAVLRDDTPAYSTFSFGGVTWENYRGSVGGVDYVPATKAYLVPLGVPNLFVQYNAPADYVETVGTMGLPFYSKAELMRMGKGIEIEAQANPLPLLTKPAAVVELDATGS